MRVNYSTGARFAGGGIGTTAYHAVRGYQRHDHLHRLICGSRRKTEIPTEKIVQLGILSRIWRKLAVYDRRGRIDHAYRVFYDHWAARQLRSGDVLHAWSGYNLVAMRRAKRLGLVTVLDRALVHPIYLDRLLHDECNRWGIRHHSSPSAERIAKEIAAADAVLIPSEFVRQSFVQQGVDPQKLILIPFGVDSERFRPPEDGPRPSEPFCALFMGQISVRKGAPYLLEAWQQLGWGDAELLLAGHVHLPPELYERYRTLPGVHFLDHVSDPVPVYQQAHVFVFPSVAEGSALVNYEAMACGLPVITTFNAGSIVRDGVEGKIIPAQNVAALTRTLEQLRTDEALRLEMGHAARLRAEASSWEGYGDRLDVAMQDLLEAG